MKMRILFLIVIVSILKVNAQGKNHVVELKIEKKMPINEFYVSEVIDNRLIKSNIGFAQKGIFNKRVSAVLPDSIQIYLKEQLHKIIQKESNSEPLTLVIHEFNVSERTRAMSEKGIFRFRVEFAKRVKEKLYSLWYSESVIESGGMDVTKKHGARILKGIIQSLKAFSESNWKDKKGELIELGTNRKFDYTQLAKPGLYSSFSQLADNKPTMENNYQLLKNKNQKYPKYKVLDSQGEKMNKKIIFASDGEYIYMNALRYSYDSHFVRSLMIGRYIYFEDRISDPSAAVAFGLVGAALSNKARGIVLDTETGLVHQLDKKNTLKILEPYPELKKKYLKAKQRHKLKKLLIKTINNLNNN